MYIYICIHARACDKLFFLWQTVTIDQIVTIMCAKEVFNI